MSDPCGYGDFDVALNHFSNPDVSYMGVPTGTASANNARTIRENMVRKLRTVTFHREGALCRIYQDVSWAVTEGSH